MSEKTYPVPLRATVEGMRVLYNVAVDNFLRELRDASLEADALRAKNERLSRIEAAARELFRALDYVTPRWREDTIVISERSDEVNVAWCELDAALAAPQSRSMTKGEADAVEEIERDMFGSALAPPAPEAGESK